MKAIDLIRDLGLLSSVSVDFLEESQNRRLFNLWDIFPVLGRLQNEHSEVFLTTST